MLHRLEPVEIFDQFVFLFDIQRNNISVREFIWVVLQSFVDTFGLYSIQLGNIPIEDNLLISNDDNFVLCFYDVFFLSHIFDV